MALVASARRAVNILRLVSPCFVSFLLVPFSPLSLCLSLPPSPGKWFGRGANNPAPPQRPLVWLLLQIWPSDVEFIFDSIASSSAIRRRLLRNVHPTRAQFAHLAPDSRPSRSGAPPALHCAASTAPPLASAQARQRIAHSSGRPCAGRSARAPGPGRS